METLKFVIYETPFCCWDWELQKKNLEFLEGIDAEYFKYIVDCNIDNLEGDNKHRAATSLRLAYSHGLETLFALLCSAVQAPQCSIGWVLNYRNLDLVNLVNKISNREPIYTRFKEPPITWKVLAKHIHANLGYEQNKNEWIQEGFGQAWLWFASEFTDENVSLEYNGIKHGLRAKPGGFHLAFGHEHTPGVPAPPEKMMSLGGSKYGSSYFVKEHVIAANKINFRPSRHARNWSPQNLAYGLLLISMSINNVISWLRVVNGVQPEKCKFVNPSSKEEFERPWKESVGVTHTNFDLTINEENVVPFSKEEILKSYE